MLKKIPEILILGRPNVGKSTLLNRIVGRTSAITYDTPGVTRDLASYLASWEGREFIITDSGGLFLEKNPEFYLQNKIENLIQKAIQRANKIIFLTECKSGLSSLDEIISQWLRPHQEKVILAVNKADPGKKDIDIAIFYKLGMGKPMAISSAHGTGIQDLLVEVTKDITTTKEIQSELKESYNLSIIGRPNVGKSSLVNALLNEERVLVDPTAGTTRDATEFFFRYQDHKYIFIDTAGIRKKARIKDDIEYYSIVRSSRAIKRSDLVLVLLEPDNYMCDQDKKIIKMVLDAHKNMVILLNKWDLTPRTNAMRKNLMRIARELMPVLNYYPFIFISAKEKANIGKIFNLAPSVIASSEKRIPTSQLNKFVEAAIKHNPLPAKGGRNIKIYYVTQPETSPPTFIFFINDLKLITAEYRRFLERKIRESLDDYSGNSIRIFFKPREKMVFTHNKS
ncbi:ribosome biogenesis GTPase Der [Candidatus Margulisiibacteriota bacterium]